MRGMDSNEKWRGWCAISWLICSMNDYFYNKIFPVDLSKRKNRILQMHTWRIFHGIFVRLGGFSLQYERKVNCWCAWCLKFSHFNVPIWGRAFCMNIHTCSLMIICVRARVCERSIMLFFISFLLSLQLTVGAFCEHHHDHHHMNDLVLAFAQLRPNSFVFSLYLSFSVSFFLSVLLLLCSFFFSFCTVVFPCVCVCVYAWNFFPCFCYSILLCAINAVVVV